MTKTVLLKFFMAIVITFILILPEHFKTPKGRTLELSCLEECFQPNSTNSLSSLNSSFVTFLQPVRETQTVMGIFLNYSHFQNFTKICQDITSEFKTCSSCLVCEAKGNMDSISQEQTSKVLIMKGSMEMKENDFYSPCQHFNFTVTPIVDHVEEYNTTCDLQNHTRKSITVEEDPIKEKSTNHTCRIMDYPNNCIHIFLHLEMSIKNVTCSMKITWYILILLVFIFFIILIIFKIVKGRRRIQMWQSHTYKGTSVLLRGSDSEKLRALNARVISGELRDTNTTAQEIPTLHPLTTEQVQEVCYYHVSYMTLDTRRHCRQCTTGELLQTNRHFDRVHTEAALGSDQGSAPSNTRTGSPFCSSSLRSIHMIIPGQIGLNPVEEYL